MKGAFPALSQMRDEGVIKAWCIGVNTPEPILRVMQESDPDVCLLASQYSLIDHANALNNVFPVARQRDVSFVVGSSLNAGFISGSSRYNYGKNNWNISQEHLAKRDRLRAVANQFGVDIRTAALQFSAAPDVAVSLIVGAHTEAQALANASSMKVTIPQAFWAELKRQKIEQNAPVPEGGAYPRLRCVVDLQSLALVSLTLSPCSISVRNLRMTAATQRSESASAQPKSRAACL